MALLSMDEIRELERIADEKDRRVVAHQIPVALLGIELEGKAAHIALGIGGAEFTGYGGEAGDEVGFLADAIEDRRPGIWREILGEGEGAVGAPALGVDHPLGDALAVLMGELFKQLPILHQYRAARAGGEAVLVVGHRTAGSCGLIGTFPHVLAPLRYVNPVTVLSARFFDKFILSNVLIAWSYGRSVPWPLPALVGAVDTSRGERAAMGTWPPAGARGRSASSPPHRPNGGGVARTLRECWRNCAYGPFSGRRTG